MLARSGQKILYLSIGSFFACVALYGTWTRYCSEDLQPKGIAETVPGWDTAVEPWFDDVFSVGPLDHPSSAAQLRLLQANGFDLSKLAVIIEPRNASTLHAVLWNVIGQLPQDWPLRVYHAANNRAWLLGGEGMTELIASGKITPVEIATSIVKNENDVADILERTQAIQVSNFLKSRKLWENQSPAKHVFFFQVDSITCGKSMFTIDDFLQWDFVGAPVELPGGLFYNGGFSMRNRERVLEVIDTFGATTTDDEIEDVWFSYKMRALHANLPTVEQATKFSIDSRFDQDAFGAHQFWPHMSPELMERVKEVCPEVSVIMPDSYYNPRETETINLPV